ncbi:LacI family DNA-binding transcriptional regulator [Candidatus Bipolaricaulota bacterium]|nr:LacI family DNA-binding transcriptional regulator [Candidatus Bipolaricaulota bacterium]
MNKPTIRDVAERAGVSTATVSRALNEPRSVSDELKEEVMEAIEELNYKPSSLAQGLKTNMTNTLALVITDNESPFYAKIMRGVEDVALENDYSLFVSNTDEELKKEKLYLEKLQDKATDGIILAPTGRSNEKLNHLLEFNTPIVFIDRWLEELKDRVDTVLANNLKGSYQAVEYLLQKGHERIGIITGVKQVVSSEERLEGYKKALKDKEISIKDELIVEGSYTIEGGVNALKTLLSLKERPTAVFVTNGKMTMGALKLLREKGYTCPDDLSLVSFDDFEWFSILNPPVTAVRQDSYEIGTKSANLLLKKINSGNNESTESVFRVGTELVIRNSVKKV